MKCLNREEIQFLLDNELESNAAETYRLHITQCEHCRQLYKQAEEEKNLLSAFFNMYDEVLKTQEIPVFIKPKTRIIHWILRAAACVLVLLGVGFAWIYTNTKNAENTPVIVKNTTIEESHNTPLPIVQGSPKPVAIAKNTDSKPVSQNQFPLEELDHNQQWRQMREQGIAITILDNSGNVIHKFTSIN